MLGSGRKEGCMPRLRHTAEQILAKLREAEVALSKGQSVAHVCHALSITEQASVMNCWIGNFLRHSGRRRRWWSAGGRPTTGFVSTVRWVIDHRHRKPSRRNTVHSHCG